MLELEWPEREHQAGRRVLEQVVEPGATRIVAMGGGTGLPVVLRGLVRQGRPGLEQPGVDITAVVAMSDDGGSSGRLRREQGMLPPGDVRNCLVALARERGALARLFQYRFGGTRRGLGGHAMGNLLIAALAELEGGFLEAVRVSEALLGVQGRVLPSTVLPVQLVAEREDASVVVGERHLTRARGRVRRVSLVPGSPPPTRGLLEALQAAQLIAIGPGSLYSSVLPNLLVEGVAQTLRESRALKVLVANLMTQPGETEGMDCLAHVQAVLEHAGPVVDVVLVNATPPSPQALERYAQRGSFPVQVDRRALLSAGVVPVEADLLRMGAHVRHDGSKVARCLLKLARQGL